jgi:hypothetical protein
MRNLTTEETKEINGGFAIDPFTGAICAAIAVLSAAYAFGKDAAERERRLKGAK